jgi:Mrp family chromosome partitioning ATPase
VKRAASIDMPGETTAASWSSPIQNLASDQLQAAARLKIAAGPDRRVIAVSGILEEDGAATLAFRLGEALCALEREPVLIIETGTGEGACDPLDLLNSGASITSAARSVADPHLFAIRIDRQENAAILASAHGRRLLEAMRREFRYILIDGGYTRDSAQGMILASAADGLVLAAKAGVRRRHEIEEFQRDLERLKIPLLGVLLTTGPASK